MPVSAFAQPFDEIVARVAAGETLTNSCAALGIKRGTLNSHLRAHPDLRARLDAAKPKTGVDLVADRFDEILAAIRNGSTMESAVEAAGCSVPSFLRYVRRTQEASNSYVGATTTREAGDNARGKSATARRQHRFRAEDFEAALEALSDATRKYEDIFSDASLPSDGSVANYARRNASFRERLADVMASRRQARADARPKPEPKVERPLGQLLKALKLNPLYAAAFRVVRNFDSTDRDDAISEIILALLEGKLSESNLTKEGKRYAYRQVFAEARRLASLDAPVFENNDVKMAIDTIANPDPILFY